MDLLFWSVTKWFAETKVLRITFSPDGQKFVAAPHDANEIHFANQCQEDGSENQERETLLIHGQQLIP